MNSYMITIKEDNTRQYFIDGTSKDNAIENYNQDMEDGNWPMSNGNDVSTYTIIQVMKCGTNIKRNQTGKIIKSDELTKENSEHNKSRYNNYESKPPSKPHTVEPVAIYLGAD